MRFRPILCTFLFAVLPMLTQAAVSLPADSTAALPAETDGPAKEAMQAFQDGRHAKAVELAKPLADSGNADALYLLGFAHESGQGAEASREKALEFYGKAAEAKHKDAVYRMSFILLASEDEKERAKAREALESAAKEDPAVAGRILGEAFLRGLVTEKPDGEKALFWWNAASDAGDIPSILLAARLYEGQFGFPELTDLKKSLESYGKAAGFGNAGAMVALGSRQLNGPIEIRNEDEGRKWLQKAIENKEYSAYLALGDFEENVNEDLKAALAAYERGKDAGQIDCALRAADFYLEGKGTEKDEKRAMTILEKAAEDGNPLAHLKLAARKLAGESPDMLGGYQHLVQAATGGLAEAQNEIALLYLSGKLGAADPAAAVAWLTRAAQAGFAQAQNNLAALYERGAGVPQNVGNAGQLYSLAANQGHGPATFALARLFAQGLGTETNLPKAWALATLAAERGVEDADEMIADLNKRFDEPLRAAARKELEAIRSGKSTEETEAP